MTQEQKEIIIASRRAGVAYGKIAQDLEISINTVKSFCKRNIGPVSENEVEAESKPEPLTEENAIATGDAPHHCKYCGKPIIQVAGHRERKFCSAVCRTRWWGKYGAEKNHRHPAVCQKCGRTFFGRPGRKYCCHACYIAERFGEVHVS